MVKDEITVTRYCSELLDNHKLSTSRRVKSLLNKEYISSTSCKDDDIDFCKSPQAVHILSCADAVHVLHLSWTMLIP